MKEILLKRIRLQDWKSLNIEIDFNESATHLKGRNGVGKSSIQEAWNWLLTGYTNPSVPKNFKLFDDRKPLSNDTPAAKVTAVVSIDGEEYTISRSARAKFSRKRGTSEYVKDSSDEYVIAIDKIETSASSFQSWIESNICPLDMLPYILSGEFFTALVYDDKEQAKKIMQRIIGEVKPEDFKGDYSLIVDKLRKYTTEEIIAQSKTARNDLDSRLDVLPNEIANKQSWVASLKAMNFDEKEAELAKLQAEIESIDLTILGNAKVLKPIKEHNQKVYLEIQEKNFSIEQNRWEHNNQQKNKEREINAQIETIDEYNAGVRYRNANAKKVFENAKKSLEKSLEKIDRLSKRREKLLEERDAVKAMTFTDDACAYCGAPLTGYAFEKAREEFNKKKRVELDGIVMEGRDIRNELEKEREKSKSLTEEIANGVKLEEEKSKEELTKELEEIKSVFIPYEDTDEYKRLENEKKKLFEEIEDIPQEDNEKLTDRKRELMSEMARINRELGLKNEIEIAEAELEELRQEQRDLSVAKARYEQIIDKCKEWEQEKNEIISYRINGKMSDTRISMWSTQKSGAMVPDCVITSKENVNYATLNHSTRIKVQIELQKLFCRYYGVVVPTFIDEFGCFDSFNVPVIDGQYITMEASDSPIIEIE